jgi:hypothetical protein
MSSISRLLHNLSGVKGLGRLTEDEIREFRRVGSALPSEYIEFVMDVGYGNLGSMQIYSRPIKAEDKFAGTGQSLQGILLFGDDLQGYLFGFDANQGNRVIEVDPMGCVHAMEERDFTSLVEAYMR